MIDHLRSNKGKEFMYIAPVKSYPHKIIADYIILKIQIVNIHNKASEMKILEVIREETGSGFYTYSHKIKSTVWGSNKYIYPITNKFKEGAF